MNPTSSTSDRYGVFAVLVACVIAALFGALTEARADGALRAQERVAEADRHITGQQLCLGLRDFAIDRYGMLAPAVLGHWNIRRTEDFGRIVFAMVQHGLLSKTSDDTLEDFRSIYDFKEAFSSNEVATRISAN